MASVTSSYLDLPQRQQQLIVDDVRGSIATFNGPSLSGDDLADLVRWTVDAFYAHASDEYDRGYEDGYECAVMEDREAAEAKAEASGG